MGFLTLTGDVRTAEMVVPILKDDGENRPEMTVTPQGLRAILKHCALRLRSDGGPLRCDGTVVNRTGIYHLMKAPMLNGRIRLAFDVSAI